MERAKGTLQIESTYGEGSRFVVTLPIGYTREQFASHSSIRPTLAVCQPEEPRRATLMILHEEESQLQRLTQQLQHVHYDVYGVRTWEQLERSIEEREAHLVLIDVMQVERADERMLRTIRRKLEFYQVPFLLLVKGQHIPSTIVRDVRLYEFIVDMTNAELLQAKIELFLTMRRTVQRATKQEVEYYVSQISPHFLYNTLNMLISIHAEDPHTVEDVLYHLTTYFRAKLSYMNAGEYTSLQEELQLVEAYIAIEQLRFSDVLHVAYRSSVRSTYTLVPALALQTIVEYMINEHILKQKEGGTLTIDVQEEEGVITIVLEEEYENVLRDMKVVDEEERPSLWNVHYALQRLRSMDGVSCELNRGERGLQVCIQLNQNVASVSSTS